MDNNELLSILNGEIQSCVIDTELSQAQSKAMDYYHGKFYGDEEEGQSSIVTREVLDTIEWEMPSLMRVFAGNDKAVQFDPVSMEDIEQAEQETDFVNYIFNKENDGYMILHDWMKSALLQKNAYVKVWVEQEEEIKSETYTGLTEYELSEVLSQPGVEAVESESYTDNMGNEVYNLKINIIDQENKIRVMPVPQEDLGVTSRHGKLSLKDCEFCYHKSDKTISDLLEMGFDKELVESLPSDDDPDKYNDLELSRDYLNEQDYDDAYDESMRKITIYECYIRMCMDDTGIARLHKVIKAGNKILDIEEADFVPFAVLCPIPMPFEHIGLSSADLVMDIQRISSVLTRQSLNNLYLTNNPQYEVLANKVNMDDMLTFHAGSIKRVTQMGSIAPLTIPFTAGQSMPFMEKLQDMKENRTGISRSTMGLDANTLAKSTEGAFMGAMEQANQRIEMRARNFAETGIKDMFLMIHELAIKHLDKEKIIRLRGEYVQVLPTEWKHRANMTVNVGLGTANKERKVQRLFKLIEKLEKHMEGNTTLVSPKQVYNAYKDLLEDAGFMSVDSYFIDPDSPEGQQMQQQKAQQAQQPNPQVMAIQAQQQIEQQKRQIETQKSQQDMQIKMQESQQSLQIKAKELELKERELVLKERELEMKANQVVNEMVKHNDDIAVKLTDIEAKTSTNQDINYQENKKLNG